LPGGKKPGKNCFGTAINKKAILHYFLKGGKKWLLRIAGIAEKRRICAADCAKTANPLRKQSDWTAFWEPGTEKQRKKSKKKSLNGKRTGGIGGAQKENPKTKIAFFHFCTVLN
jgi:hypothetical protein